MQDSEWGEAPQPKRRIPTWAWWTCGGGCLVVLLAGAAIAFFLVNTARKATDPVRVWAGVAEVLPHDEPPEGWEATMGFSVMGVGQYQLSTPEPAGCLFQIQTFPDAAQIDLAFDPDSPQNVGLFGIGELREAEEGDFVLQGREVRCLRFLGGVPGMKSGAGARLDLSGGASPHAYVQILFARASEKPTDEEIQELFLPFDVWREP